MGRPLYYADSCSFCLLLSSSFFPRLFSAVRDWMSTTLHTWCGLSVNWECLSEMCCMCLGEKIQDAKIMKKIAICAPSHNFVWLYLHNWGTCRQSGKKLVKQQYLLQMSSQYGELPPTNGWDRLASFGHPSKFQRVSYLGFVTAPTSLNGGQPKFARCLAVFCYGTLYINFWELWPPNGILPGAKFTLHPSLAFAYIGNITAWHLSTGVSQTLRHGTRNAITELSCPVRAPGQ